MVSLGKMRNAIYYLAYTAYYVLGGEPIGKWLGKGAERLGLVGAVRKRHLQNIVRGLSPKGDALVKNVGSKKRNAGIDLTFSAPKGVSVLWAIAPKWLRLTIEGCHDRAVRRALQFLEEELLFLRRGRNGTQQHQCEMVAALFQHSSSRLGDPDLHTHALVFNAGHAAGRWNAIDARHIYAWKMALGALYRTQLVHELWRTIGLPFELIKTWVEVRGLVPKRLIQYFSKRSRELRAAMRLYGADSAKASDIASLRTRKAKRIIPRPELFRQWRREAKALGFGRESVEALLEAGTIGMPTKGFEPLSGLMPLLTNAIHASIDDITAFISHFPRRLLLETFLPRATEFKISADMALQAIDDVLRFDAEIVDVGERHGEPRYATRTTLAQEKQLKKYVAQLREQAGCEVPHEIKRKTMLAHGELAMEQLNGLDYLLDGQGRIKALVGVPGGGKTRLLAAAFDAWTDAGMKVIGCSVMGRAARNLRQKSGIDSSTIRRLQLSLEKANDADEKLAAAPSVCGLPALAPDKISLDENTVLVVDEAGMVSTADTLDLLTRVVAAGATLLLVGDENQLPPIGAGAPFEAITKDIVHASLTQIRRFSDPADKEALRLITDGKPEQALQLYADRKLLVVEESPHAVREKVVADWVHQGGVNRPQDHIILVGTNAQRKYYNDELQKQRQTAGVVALEGNVVRGELLAHGDRVMFLKNDRRLKVNNGEIGTVTNSDSRSQQLTVTFNSGREVTFSLKKYDALTRAYAATVHKFQGGDVPNTYCVLGGPRQSKELTFTQLSRHQNLCCLYTDKIEAGEKLERLHRQIRTPSRECLAIEMLARKEAQTPPPGGDFDPEKKIPQPIRLKPVERQADSPKLTIAQRSERPVNEVSKQDKPALEQPSQRAGWISLKRRESVSPNEPVRSENASSQKQQLPPDAPQRPNIRLAPAPPPTEIQLGATVRQAESPQLAATVDHRKTPAPAVDKPAIASAADPQRISLTHRNGSSSPTRQESTNDEAGKRIVPPAAAELRKVLFAPRVSDAPTPLPKLQTVDPEMNRRAPDAMVAVPRCSPAAQTPTAEQAALGRSSLAFVTTRDRSPAKPENSPVNGEPKDTTAKKRSAETLAEQEHRIAREESARNIHEDNLHPPMDPTRSGPKPT